MLERLLEYRSERFSKLRLCDHFIIDVPVGEVIKYGHEIAGKLNWPPWISYIDFLSWRMKGRQEDFGQSQIIFSRSQKRRRVIVIEATKITGGL
jgi:hypothetical protein